MTHRSRVLAVVLATLCMAFMCEPDPAPPATDPPADPMDPPTPPGTLPPRPTEPFAGDMGCRPWGVQPVWIDAQLPIPLSWCSRNMQVFLPFAVYNTVAAGDGYVGELGRGWSLSIDQSLVVRGDSVSVRRGDLTERRFQRVGDHFVPEPYLFAALLLEDPDPAVEGDEVYTFVDLETGDRFVFSKGAASWPAYRLHHTVDRHGVEVSYRRDGDGHLLTITDTTLHPDATPWYTIGWAGARVSDITDAAGLTTTYDYDGAGNLERVTLPLGAGEHVLRYGSPGMLTSRTMPGFETTPITYELDGQGRLVIVRGPGPEDRWEVTDDAFLDIGERFGLEGGSGVRYRVELAHIAHGIYASRIDAAGVRREVVRNDEGYLVRQIDPTTGRSTRYEPDDARRPGSTTIVRHPDNDDGEAGGIEEITWGDYYAPVVINRSPGPTTHLRYEGVGEGCGEAFPPWALGLACAIETGAQSVRMRHRTDAQGTDDERRLTIYEHAHEHVADFALIRDAWGRLVETRYATGGRDVYTRDARGFVTRRAYTVEQGGEMATSWSRVEVSYPNEMGEVSRAELTDASGAVIAGSAVYRDAMGRIDRREMLGAGGAVVSAVRYEDRSAAGFAQREVQDVITDGETRTGFVFHELDEYGRTRHSESFVPDHDWGDDEHEGVRGHRLMGGRASYGE
ncbi:MAG: hypothetical protein AB7S26_24015 [Sandaracinaceae bacterium]